MSGLASQIQIGRRSMRLERQEHQGTLIATQQVRPEVRDWRYPALFDAQRPSHQRLVRPGTGLRIITAEHQTLTPDELEAIGQFRLQQYILAGLYDADTVARLGITTDPEMHRLAPTDIHLAIGDADGRFLFSGSFQSACIPPRAQGVASTDVTVHALLGDVRRLYFPCEVEFGGSVYVEHPALALIPTQNTREMLHFVQNQELRTLAAGLSISEVIVATVRLLCTSESEIELVVGCCSPELRRALWAFGIPLAYAPDAEDDQAYAWDDSPERAIWTREAHSEGRFWPAALSSLDLRRDMDYFDCLDSALSLPIREVPRALKALRRHALPREPRYVFEPAGGAGLRWVANPFPQQPDVP
jgi:hypothetical protein